MAEEDNLLENITDPIAIITRVVELIVVRF